MLRGNYKTKLIYGGGLLAAFSLTIGSAMARELVELAPYVAKLESSTSLPCPNPEYWIYPPMGPKQPKGSYQQMMCQSQCTQTLQQQASTIRSKYNAAVASDAAANGSSAANSAAAAGNSNGFAVVQQGAQNSNGAGAKAGLQQKSANAASVATAAKQCSQQIDSACREANIASIDMQIVNKAKQACDELANASDQVAAEKAKSSGEMGDMSQMADMLKQAMGMLQGQGGETPEQPDITDSSPPPAAIAGTGFDNSNPTAGMKIGDSTNPNGAEFKSPKNNISGFGPAASSGYGSGYDSISGTGYGDSGSGGTSVGAGYSSGGGSSSLNSTGSSMASGEVAEGSAADAAAAAATGESYEVNTAGGGGSKPAFLGLKSRTDEEVASGGESVLGDLGLDDGSRDLASNDEPAGGIGEANGNTLFHVVHTKIAEIKKRGSI